MFLSGSNSSLSSPISLNAGTLNFASGSLGSGTLTFAGNATLQFASGNTQDVSNQIAAIPSGVSAIIDTNGNPTVSFGTGLSGQGGLTKAGLGTLTLTATNTYSGPTQVNAGTLRVTGSLGGGTVTVGGASASGSPTLSGSGSIPGPVTIASGNGGTAGHLAPSGMAGTTTNMNLSGGLTLADGASPGTGAVLDFNVVSPSSGDLVTTGNLYLGTNGVLNINPFGGGGELATGYYPLIDFTTLTSSDNSATWSVGTTDGDSGHSYNLVIVGSDLDLHVTTATLTGSSSWTLNNNGEAASATYGNSSNWYQQTVPDGTGQTATFVNSSVTALTQTVTIEWRLHRRRDRLHLGHEFYAPIANQRPRQPDAQ